MKAARKKGASSNTLPRMVLAGLGVTCAVGVAGSLLGATAFAQGDDWRLSNGQQLSPEQLAHRRRQQLPLQLAAAGLSALGVVGCVAGYKALK